MKPAGRGRGTRHNMSGVLARRGIERESQFVAGDGGWPSNPLAAAGGGLLSSPSCRRPWPARHHWKRPPAPAGKGIGVKRREFITLLGGTAVDGRSRAQQPAIQVIGLARRVDQRSRTFENGAFVRRESRLWGHS